jgi:hypothetical protein
LDLLSGNMQDPQSLHKYLYVHGDPVNGIDPTGLMIEPWPDSIKGMQAHKTFSEYCHAVAPGIRLPGFPLGTVLPNLYPPGDPDRALKPDAIDVILRTYYELKPVTHEHHSGIQTTDYLTQLGRYDTALPPKGYFRGNSIMLVPYARGGWLLGRFQDLSTGKWYTVKGWPEQRFTLDSGFPGKGLIYYDLEEEDKHPVPIPIIVWNDDKWDDDIRIQIPKVELRPLLQQYTESGETIAAATALAVTAGVIGGAYLASGLMFRSSLTVRFGF